MFEMSRQELEQWRDQFATTIGERKGIRYAPFCFTEQGVTMLSCVLNSGRAIQLNIQIVRIFTKIREMLTDTLNVKLEIEEIKRKLENQDKNIELVFAYLDGLIEKQENPNPRPKEASGDNPKKTSYPQLLFVSLFQNGGHILYILSLCC